MTKKKSDIKNTIKPHTTNGIKNTKEPESYLNYPIVFAFDLLDRNEYFDFTKTCDKWAVILLEAFKELSSRSLGELYNNRGKNLSAHLDVTATACPIVPPHNISKADITEIRFSRSNGRIHGWFDKNVFHLIWIDPLHNVYPDDRYGGARKIKMVDESCCDSLLKEMQRMDERIKHLEYLEEILDRETK